MNLINRGWAQQAQQLVARLISSGVNSTDQVLEIEPADNSASRIDIALTPKGGGALMAATPDGGSRGNKRGQYAVDLQLALGGSTYIASGYESALIGGEFNIASGSCSAVTGGRANTASGQWATCLGQSNAATGANSTAIGNINTASGDNSVCVGGQSNTASGISSSTVGGAYATTRGITGYIATSASNVPLGVSTPGAQQTGLLIIAKQTTSATTTLLNSNNTSTGSTNNQVILPNNGAYSFSGEVIAGVTGAGNTARWTISGAIKRGASAATTVMVGTPTVTMTHNDAGAAAWTVAVTADTTNGGIKVEVTGAESTTIRWVCRIQTTEMSF